MSCSDSQSDLVNSTLERQNQDRAAIVAEEGEHRDEESAPGLLDQLIEEFDVVGLESYDSADEGYYYNLIHKCTSF